MQGFTTQSASSLDLPFNGCCFNISKNLESWARDFAERSRLLDEVPKRARPYFDYASWARDALYNGDIWIIELSRDEIAVFYKKD